MRRQELSDDSAGSRKDASRRVGRLEKLSGVWVYARRNPDALLVLALACFFVGLALLPGVLAPYDPHETSAELVLQAPSSLHWLGTDHLGRDILSRLVHGTRVIMMVGLGGVGLSTLVGVLFGLASGFYGGWVDSLVMRATDALLAFPTLLLAIIFVAAFGASALNVVIVIVLGYTPRFIRLVRAATLVLKRSDFVLAARAIGSADTRLLFRHILPNALVPIIVQATLGVGFAFLIEAAMSYLGFGVQPPAPSWGAMLNTAQLYMYDAPWYVLAPGFAIFVAVLTFNLAGDRLRDAVDPRLVGLS